MSDKKKEPGFRFYLLWAVIALPTAITLWHMVAGFGFQQAVTSAGLWSGAVFATFFAGGAIIGMFTSTKDDDK